MLDPDLGKWPISSGGAECEFIFEAFTERCFVAGRSRDSLRLPDDTPSAFDTTLFGRYRAGGRPYCGRPWYIRAPPEWRAVRFRSMAVLPTVVRDRLAATRSGPTRVRRVRWRPSSA